MPDITRIRDLNDTFRRGDGNSIAFCTAFTITQGVAALGDEFVDAAMAAVVAYDDFTEANDPYGVHDFGAFDLEGQKLFWKIDYYDKALRFGSDDPGDPDKTCRVLTILLAEEYLVRTQSPASAGLLSSFPCCARTALFAIFPWRSPKGLPISFSPPRRAPLARVRRAMILPTGFRQAPTHLFWA